MDRMMANNLVSSQPLATPQERELHARGEALGHSPTAPVKAPEPIVRVRGVTKQHRRGTKVIQVVEDQPREQVAPALSEFLRGIRAALDS